MKNNVVPIFIGAVTIILVGIFAKRAEAPDAVLPLVEPAVISAPEREEVVVTQAPRDLEAMIRWQALSYGINSEQAILIALCESRLDPYAQNPTSSAKGLYQFTDPTWEYIKAQGHQFDAEENIKQFMIWYSVHPEWWECE